MTTDSPKRHYTTPKKLKLMTPEELKAHKHELYKRHYKANKDKIGEKQKKLYQKSDNFREEKLINNYKNFYKLTNDEIALFNHCYKHIREYTENKRRFNSIIKIIKCNKFLIKMITK